MKTKLQLRQINFSRVKDNNDTIWSIGCLISNTKLISEERFSKFLNGVLNSKVPIIQDINPIELVSNKISPANWFFLNAYRFNLDDSKDDKRYKVIDQLRSIFINPENFYISFIGSSETKRKYIQHAYDEFEFNRKLNKFVEKKFLTYEYVG